MTQDKQAGPTLKGGQIHITIHTPDKTDEAAKVIRVHEIHNETLCTLTTYLDGEPVAGEGGNQGQHPYDTSEHAQEHQNEARSSVIGGTIIIEIHNETRLIENKFYTSAKGRDGASSKRDASSVDIVNGETDVPADKKARLAIEPAAAVPIPTGGAPEHVSVHDLRNRMA